MPFQFSDFGRPLALSCERCEATFIISTSDRYRQYPRRYCSTASPRAPRARTGQIDQVCAACGTTFTTWKAWIKRGRGKFCSKHCSRRGIPIETRLALQTDRSSPDGCWPWNGWRDDQGYGRLNVHGGFVTTHRLAFALASGLDLPDKAIIGHVCDYPPCLRNDGDEGAYVIDGASYVRFGHLFLTDRAGNRRDCVLKGRQAQGDRSKSRLYPGINVWKPNHLWRLNPELGPRGAQNGRAKLTEAKVIEIRAAHAQGATFSELAEANNVTTTTIRGIVMRRLWSHI